MYDYEVECVKSSSKPDVRWEQGIHRQQTLPPSRNAASGSRFTVQPPCFAI